MSSTDGAQPASPLIQLKQIPRVHLVRDVRELVAPAVGDDHVAASLKGLQVVRHLGAEELRHAQRGLADHNGHALSLHVLHEALDGALDGARADVVGVSLHRQAVHAYDRPLFALVITPSRPETNQLWHPQSLERCRLNGPHPHFQ